MNKIGIYYAYWTRNWNVDFHPYIDKVADLGFDILEIHAGSIARMLSKDRKDLKKYADTRNITLTFGIGLPPEFDLASEDAEYRKNGINFLQKTADAIGEMGGGVLGGIIYSSWPASLPFGTIDKRPYFDRSVASMRKAIKAAESNNVTFNMEVVNRFEQYIMNICTEGLEYVNAVDSPNAKVMLDTFHMNIEEDFIDEAIIKAGEKLGHLHIGENNRMPPGCGHIPWSEISKALQKIRYQGYIVMEPFLVPGGEVGRDIRINHDSSVGLNLDLEARKALQFMLNVLSA